MDDDTFSNLMTSVDAPMVVVTTAMEHERAGCLVGFHAQSSIEPARYCVWLSKANHTYRVALLSNHLAVHFLTEDDRQLAGLFGTRSGDDVDKFANVDHELGPHGVPLLSACPNRLLLRRLTLLDEGGDHVCVVSTPEEASTGGAFRPLRLSAVDDLPPGHETDERNDPPTERSAG